MEIETTLALDVYLDSGGPLRGVRLQDLDLRGYADTLRDNGDLTGLVVLGGLIPDDVLAVLMAGGAIVFPGVADAPIDPWRGLYSAFDLYAGLDQSYAVTPDARAYHWYQDTRGATDAYATLVRAIHDDSVTDELDEFVIGRRLVGVMGGHALARGSDEYADAARLGHDLAGRGFLVTTGGGPGAMEAANLGAFARDSAGLDAALIELATVPSFVPDITAWADVAMQVRAQLRPEPEIPIGEAPKAVAEHARSLGIPTWFYGHEPPNVFCDVIAKYFSNALREESLLSRSNAGIIVLRGAAGTVQEIFQAVTPLYYAPDTEPLPPLILVGREHWSEVVPVWPVLTKLGEGRRMADCLHLVETLDEAAAIIST